MLYLRMSNEVLDELSMTIASCQQIDNVLHFFTSQQLSILDFFWFLLTDGSIASHPMVLGFLGSRSEVISLLISMEPQEVGFQCAHNLMRQRYKDEIRELLKVEHSWQFNALHASANQIDQFRIEDMASSMERQSHYLWSLLGQLLSSAQSEMGGASKSEVSSLHNDANQDSEEDDLWDQLGDLDLEAIIETLTDSPVEQEQRKITGRKAILEIVSQLCDRVLGCDINDQHLQKKVVILSILMQRSNPKTNALESIIGIFLHSCGTLEKVIETLAHLGISISLNAIHNTITSLSIKSANAI
jgi:hypothetical protein